MRLYPPVYLLGREAVREVEIGGYRLPRGTVFLMSQWVVHRDPRFFPEPEMFKPERWGDSRDRQRPRFAYFPFGGGPRICIGQPLAMMEAKLDSRNCAPAFSPRRDFRSAGASVSVGHPAAGSSGPPGRLATQAITGVGSSSVARSARPSCPSVMSHVLRWSACIRLVAADRSAMSDRFAFTRLGNLCGLLLLRAYEATGVFNKG